MNKLTQSDAGRIGGYITGKLLHQQKLKHIQEYNKTPKFCKVCGKPIEYNKRFNKCCSQHCSAILSNTGRHHTLQTKQKISNTLKKNKKSKICKWCGCEINNINNHNICKKYRIFKSLEKFGFNKKVIGTIKLFEEYNKIKSIIEKFYKDNSSDTKLLKQQFNYISGSANFHKLLKSLDIETRNSSDANRKTYIDGKNVSYNVNTKYITGWHITWNNKKYFLRSSYEFDFANYLDDNKINYEVETLRIQYFDSIKNIFRCAIPDFYLPETNTIIEIKSDWTLDIQNMIDKFKTYNELGYNTKLILEHNEVKLNDILRSDSNGS